MGEGCGQGLPSPLPSPSEAALFPPNKSCMEPSWDSVTGDQASLTPRTNTPCLKCEEFSFHVWMQKAT